MTTRTTFATLIAAATLSVGGVALAQTSATDMGKDAPTSTAGAGCTATGNAMRGGNLGGTPNKNINCAPTAAAQTATTTTTTTETTASQGGSTSMAGPAAATTETTAAAPRKTRVARADRN